MFNREHPIEFDDNLHQAAYNLILESKMSKQKVKEFMIKSNRPYSTNDVIQNLGKELSKNAQKYLDELVDENVLFDKVYGKSKIYCAVQVAKQDSGELDSKILSLKTTLSNLEVEYRKEEATLRSLLATETTENIENENRKLLDLNNSLRSKLEAFMNCDKPVERVDPKEMENVRKRKSTLASDYKKRKRICTDILYQVLESYPKTQKHLYQEIGIEEDPPDMPKL